MGLFLLERGDIYLDLGERGFRVSARARYYSNEAALSLRSRRSGTKFANPYGFAY